MRAARGGHRLSESASWTALSREEGENDEDEEDDDEEEEDDEEEDEEEEMMETRKIWPRARKNCLVFNERAPAINGVLLMLSYKESIDARNRSSPSLSPPSTRLFIFSSRKICISR